MGCDMASTEWDQRHQSAQPCGCDDKAGWVCEQHKHVYYWRSNPKGEGFIPIKLTTPKESATLPTDPVERKTYPIATGVLDYFPRAIAEIAHVSYVGNEQHNPNQPLHWDRSKSTDEADALIRHFLERGKLDKDGVRHTAKLAWRALALLEKELEIEKERG